MRETSAARVKLTRTRREDLPDVTWNSQGNTSTEGTCRASRRQLVICSQVQRKDLVRGGTQSSQCTGGDGSLGDSAQEPRSVWRPGRGHAINPQSQKPPTSWRSRIGRAGAGLIQPGCCPGALCSGERTQCGASEDLARSAWSCFQPGDLGQAAGSLKHWLFICK